MRWYLWAFPLVAGCGLLGQETETGTVGTDLGSAIVDTTNQVGEMLPGPLGLTITGIGLVASILLGAKGVQMVKQKMVDSAPGKII